MAILFSPSSSRNLYLQFVAYRAVLSATLDNHDKSRELEGSRKKIDKKKNKKNKKRRELETGSDSTESDKREGGSQGLAVALQQSLMMSDNTESGDSTLARIKRCVAGAAVD